MRILATGIAVLSVCACSNPASPDLTPTVPVTVAPTDLKSAVSAKFDAFAIPAGAACSLSVSQNGQVVLERGRGNVAPGRAADGDSLYRIASLTKPFTATAVLINEKAGRLNRDDKVNKYVAFPEPAPTIDELIKHIPGLSNYTDTFAYAYGNQTPTTLANLLSLIKPWDGVKRYQYSNSHPVLTAAALEKVNGIKFEDIIQRDIFGPVGMSRSSFAMPPASESIGFPFPSKTDSTWVLYGGGITSTAADMNRFNQALLSNRFGFGAVESFDRSAAGVTSFGMGSGVTNGDLGFTHAGGLDSYSSFTIMFPADRSSVILLCNFNNSDVDGQFKFVMGIRSTLLSGLAGTPTSSGSKN
jgi:CubicO group peptidase (beta-lactamase class C family)